MKHRFPGGSHRDSRALDVLALDRHGRSSPGLRVGSLNKRTRQAVMLAARTRPGLRLKATSASVSVYASHRRQKCWSSPRAHLTVQSQSQMLPTSLSTDTALRSTRFRRFCRTQKLCRPILIVLFNDSACSDPLPNPLIAAILQIYSLLARAACIIMPDHLKLMICKYGEAAQGTTLGPRISRRMPLEPYRSTGRLPVHRTKKSTVPV